MVVGDFTFEKDVETVDDVTILCEYALFLVQCGAKVMIVLDKERDSLFQNSAMKKLTRNTAFRRYVTIARTGTTAAERYASEVAKNEAGKDAAPVCVEERSSAETCPGAQTVERFRVDEAAFLGWFLPKE